MKNIILSFMLYLFSSAVFCQTWFKTYTDSTTLVNDANALIQQFQNDVKAATPEVVINTKGIVNTQPYLIFYNKKGVNIPMWKQLSDDSKKFFLTMRGNEKQGKKLFGLMFNGFYLPHELGHAWQGAKKMKIDDNRYESEYQANIIGMLWWRKKGRQHELKQCYRALKKAFAKLKNPVPEGQTMSAYFSKDYWSKVADPFVYGYMEFWQFIKIYEDKSLPDFDTYLKTH